MDATITEAPTSPERLVLVATFANLAPSALFAAWVEPEQLCRWWPTEAEIEPWVGGTYQLRWPGQGWTLRGRYTAFEPRRHLAFTWRWDHVSPASPTFVVDIAFAAQSRDASQLTLTHGPYSASAEDQEQRAHHLDGWRHFLARLQALPLG